MRRFLALCRWEASGLSMFLFAGPALAFGLSLVTRSINTYAGGNINEDASLTVWLIVIFALLPFAASSCFAAERESGLIRFWDFFPVSRQERYFAKWAALLAVTILTMLLSLLPPILLLSGTLGASLILGFISFPLIIAAAWGGQITRKSIVGGVAGIIFAIGAFSFSGFFSAILHDYHQSPIGAVTTGIGLFIALPWFQMRHFLQENPTDQRSLWVSRFFKIVATASCIGLSVGSVAMAFSEAFTPIPILVGTLVLLLLFLKLRRAYSVMFWGLVVLQIVGPLAFLFGSLRDGPFSAQESLILVASLMLFASVLYYLILRRLGFLQRRSTIVAVIALMAIPFISVLFYVPTFLYSDPAPFQLELKRSTDENAINRSRRLFALAETNSKMEFKLEISDSFIPSAEIRTAIDSGLPFIIEIQKILAEGSLAYPWPEKIVPEHRLPKLFVFVVASKVMVLKSQEEAFRNDPEQAARTIAGVFHLGRELRNSGGTIIQYLFGTAVLNVGCNAAKYWLAESDRYDKGLTIIAKAVRESMDDGAGIRQVFAAEFETNKSGIHSLLEGSVEGQNLTPLEKIMAPLIMNEKATLGMIERSMLRALEKDSSILPLPRFNPVNVVGQLLVEMSSPKFEHIMATKFAADANLKGLDLMLRGRASGRNFSDFWNSLPSEEKQNPFTDQPFSIVDSHLVVVQQNDSVAYPL